jgi:hypothetical protein
MSVNSTKILKTLLTIFLVLTSATATFAHEPVKDDEVMLGLRAGHNASFGYFTAASIQSRLNFNNINLETGIQYNTIGKTAIEVRPAYFKQFNWGRLSAEAIIAYTHLKSVGSISAGAGVGITGRWIGGKLGYYYRMYGSKGSNIQEPFNIYYEFCANLLPMIEEWDLQLFITNSELFELERHYQPSFIAKCQFHLMPGLGLSLGLGCKPSGMFNLSADYYQAFLNLGICYRW